MEKKEIEKQENRLHWLEIANDELEMLIDEMVDDSEVSVERFKCLVEIKSKLNMAIAGVL